MGTVHLRHEAAHLDWEGGRLWPYPAPHPDLHNIHWLDQSIDSLQCSTRQHRAKRDPRLVWHVCKRNGESTCRIPDGFTGDHARPIPQVGGQVNELVLAGVPGRDGALSVDGLPADGLIEPHGDLWRCILESWHSLSPRTERTRGRDDRLKCLRWRHLLAALVPVDYFDRWHSHTHVGLSACASVVVRQQSGGRLVSLQRLPVLVIEERSTAFTLMTTLAGRQRLPLISQLGDRRVNIAVQHILKGSSLAQQLYRGPVL
ncbi:hypothetical protein D3C71_1208940 [compost metagenome]